MVGFAALANRGFCKVANLGNEAKANAKLPSDKPFLLWEILNLKFTSQSTVRFVRAVARLLSLEVEATKG